MKVLTNALASGGATNTYAGFGTTFAEVTVTPNFSNSRIYVAAVVTAIPR